MFFFNSPNCNNIKQILFSKSERYAIVYAARYNQYLSVYMTRMNICRHDSPKTTYFQSNTRKI